MRTEIDLYEILKELPLNTRDSVMKAIAKATVNEPINFLKRFIDQYEDDSMLDNMLALLCMDLIRQIGSAVCDSTDEVDEICSLDASRIVVKELKTLAVKIESAANEIKKQRESCSKHKH